MRLRACLQAFVPKSRWSTAAQHAAFYEDGSPIAPRLDWSQSRSVEALGIEADLAGAQAPLAGVQPLREVMHECLPRLNERFGMGCASRVRCRSPCEMNTVAADLTSDNVQLSCS